MNKARIVIIIAVTMLLIGALYLPLFPKHEEQAIIHAQSATITMLSAVEESTPSEASVSQETLETPEEPQPETSQEVPVEQPREEMEEPLPEPVVEDTSVPPSPLPVETETPPLPLTSGVEIAAPAEPVAASVPVAAAPSVASEALPAVRGDSSYAELDGDTIAPVFNGKALVKRLVYPPMAKRQGIEGDALLQLYISETGVVERVDCLSEDAYGFAEAAKNAFLGFVCKPAMKNGKALAVTLRYPVRFSLR